MLGHDIEYARKSGRTKELSFVPQGTHDINQYFPSVKTLGYSRKMTGNHHLTRSTSEGARSRISAGLLMFRQKGDSSLEFLLAHPGGPFFARKDMGVWTIPKGEAQPDEDLLTRAKIEFEEETGMKPSGEFIPLGSIKQKGGKTVHAWAFEGNLPPDFQLKSNTFRVESPPRSGKFKEFPEVDRADFFAEEVARQKINSAQLPFLERLRLALAAH